MYTRMRMIAAGAAVALLTGTAASAAAATSGTASPSASSSSSASVVAPKPTPSGTDKGGVTKDQWLAKLAASLHVSVQKLQAALGDAKMTIGKLGGVAPTDPRVVAVVSHDLGISAAKATQLIKEVFGDAAPGKGGFGKPGGNQPPGTPDPRISQALAAVLHISVARAEQVLEQLDRIARPGNGISPTDPQFRALAASLHLTPQQLVDALIQMKQSLAGSMPPPSPAPSSSKS